MTQSQFRSSLDVLPEMLNQVLAQTGKVLRDQDLLNMQSTAIAKRQVNEFLTPANERFQHALDDIEIEILQAKAVIERDLGRIRRKRAERDRQGQSVATPKDVPADIDMSDLTGPIPGQTDGDTDALNNADFERRLSDVLMQLDEKAPLITDEKTADDVQVPAVTVDGLNLPQDDPTSIALSLSKIGDSEQVEKKVETAAAVPADASKTDADFEFESMFNDGDGADLKFDLDLGTDNLTGDGAGAGNLADLDLGAELSNAMGDENAGGTEDLGSLLPGLENFVNNNGSNANGDKNEGSGEQGKTGEIQPTQDNTSGDAAASSDPTRKADPATTLDETNLDDLFNSAEFNIPTEGGEEATGEGNTTGAADDMNILEGLGDFNDDEDWFPSLE